MPPKVRFDKDTVVRAAVNVVDKKGLSALTARSVATQLKSSTAPVYHHFKTMDQLALAVMKQTQKMLLDYTTRPYTDRVFLNMGTGVALFAAEHRKLYRALMLESNGYSSVVHDFFGMLLIEMKKDPRFTTMSDSQRLALLSKMWTFTHGLASLICVGIEKDASQERIVKTLLDVGADIVGAALTKHKNEHNKQS